MGERNGGGRRRRAAYKDILDEDRQSPKMLADDPLIRRRNLPDDHLVYM
jgi:hypothetical protein